MFLFRLIRFVLAGFFSCVHLRSLLGLLLALYVLRYLIDCIKQVGKQ